MKKEELEALAEERYRYETGLDDMPITKQRFQSRIDALRKAFTAGYKAKDEDAVEFVEWLMENRIIQWNKIEKSFKDHYQEYKTQSNER